MSIRALALALIVVLAGCTALPTSGPVEELPISPRPGGIELAPAPPEADAPPSRIVEGFVLAMSAPEGGYAVARQYLTARAAAKWKPTGTVIYEGEVVGSVNDASFQGRRIGRLDDTGRFSLDGGELQLNLGLVQEDGQWRIGEPPPSIVVSRYLFERNYTEVPLYFMSNHGALVVPDPIHVPRSALTPARVVNALLDGPGESIAASVSALPDGTSLGKGGARIDDDGVAVVDFKGITDDLSDNGRRSLGAQLLWSLTTFGRVTGLRVTVEGRTFALPGANASGVLELATQQGYQMLSRATTAGLYGVTDRRPGRFTGGKFTPWPVPAWDVGDLTVSLDGASAAVISTDREKLAFGSAGGALTEVPIAFTNLRAPRIVDGTVWLLGDDEAGATHLVEAQPTGTVRRLDVELPSGARLIDFAVSPTHTRVALLVESVGQRRLGLAQVLGEERQVSDWSELTLKVRGGDTLVDYQRVTWRAETALAVIASVAERTSVYSTVIDGSRVEELGSVGGDPVDLTAIPRLGGGTVAVRNSMGVTWTYEANTRWARATDKLSVIALPS